METLKRNLEIKKDNVINLEQNFDLEYKEIFNSSENTVVIKNEWTKNGDYFEKLSLYDNSYSTVITFGNTTLIK